MKLRNDYVRQLAKLDAQIAEMGAVVRDLYDSARESVEGCEVPQDLDADAAASELASRERDIETLALRLLLLQQPAAKDMREVSGVLKMVTDLKRIGELSLSACRNIAEMEGERSEAKIDELAELTSIVDEMVSCACSAYEARDISRIARVVTMEDKADAHFRAACGELVEAMHGKSVDVAQGTSLLMAAKCIERIGDHAEAIAYWTEYVAQGTYRGEPLTFIE